MTTTVDEAGLRRLLGIDGAAEPAAGPYAENARYLSSLDGFDIKRPPIPAHVFVAEREQALAGGTPTGLIPLDLSRLLDVPGPATTPLILSSYAKIRAGEALRTDSRASTALYYVIEGSGVTTFGPGGP
ncbi:MAG: hypothetical protein ACREMB_13500, partial [Candidatus Rokuibacteriota bacterium]